MSLTSRIKKDSTRQYQASDGTTYLLQRVNDVSPFLSDGMLPALLKNLGPDAAQLQQMDGETFVQRMLQDGEATGKVLRMGLEAKPRKLREGLVGELLPDGKALTYRYVDKPVHELAEGEINVHFIPDALADELVAQIDQIGKPVVEARDVSTFPGE